VITWVIVVEKCAFLADELLVWVFILY